MANDNQVPQVQVETSKFLTLNWRDLLRGFVIAVIGAALTQIYSIIDSGIFIFNWKMILTGSLVPGVSYLLRNLFEGSKTLIKVTPPLPEKVVKTMDEGGPVLPTQPPPIKIEEPNP